MEDHLWWKITFDGRRPLMENHLCWNSMENDLWWKMNIYGRPPLIEDKKAAKMFNSYSQLVRSISSWFLTSHWSNSVVLIFISLWSTKQVWLIIVEQLPSSSRVETAVVSSVVLVDWPPHSGLDLSPPQIYYFSFSIILYRERIRVFHLLTL